MFFVILTSPADDMPDEGGRLLYVTYPNGRKVHYTYGSSGDIDASLSRVAAIKNDNGSGAPGTTTYAGYSYNGAGRLVVEHFGQPDVTLNYWDDYAGTPTAGTYEGFDRFGRVVTQTWRDLSGTAATRDQFDYGYDAASDGEQDRQPGQGTPKGN